MMSHDEVYHHRPKTKQARNCAFTFKLKGGPYLRTRRWVGCVADGAGRVKAQRGAAAGRVSCDEREKAQVAEAGRREQEPALQEAAATERAAESLAREAQIGGRPNQEQQEAAEEGTGAGGSLERRRGGKIWRMRMGRRM